MQKLFKKSLLTILYSIITLGAGLIVAFILSAQINFSVENLLFYEGLTLIIIGAMASMKGNPSGINTQGAGQQGNQFIQRENLEVTQEERRATNYHQNFLKHSVTDFAFSTIAIIMSGILMLIVSYLLY